jgi:hypothetical protein
MLQRCLMGLRNSQIKEGVEKRGWRGSPRPVAEHPAVFGPGEQGVSL